jgi:hypothetical protein
MREELSQIDLSPIADLVRIKGEEELLAERLAKMEDRKEKVSAVVYQRVRRDYETRKSALEAESRPLKERARHEYAKLLVLKAKAEKSVEDASLEKEELEFRRELGEFPDEQFRERVADCEKRLAERKAEREAVVETKATFVNAFHSEEELERSVPPLPAPPPVPPPMVDSGSRGRMGTTAVPARPLDATALEPGEGPSRSADATVLEPAGRVPPSLDATVLEPGAARPGAPPPVGAASEPPGATVVLAMPRLVMMEDDKPGTEHVLKAGITVLGRSPKSDIQLPFSEVSRKHAEVVWEADGYIILDLGSENGIFVNGQKAKKQVLANGDVVQIGPQKMVFRG